jgi:mono/diheme cytochrome c family protein
LRAAFVTLAAATAVLAAGCGAVGHLTSSDGSASRGKELFQRATLETGPGCGTCHVMADAGTTGTTGPNLDDHFGTLRRQGFDESTMRDVVRGQIAYPEAPMPAELLRGQEARDVSEYVARCAGVESCDVGD